MARLSAAVIEKRENFLRSHAEKKRDDKEAISTDSLNAALVAHFGKGTPKMRAERVQEIREEVLKGTPAKQASATNGTSAKRGPGRPRKAAAAVQESGQAPMGTLFCLTGDVKRLLALGTAAGIAVQVDTRATEAISALRA